jgi:hypothetical protein
VSAADIDPHNAQEENQKHEFHRNEFVAFYCGWIFAAVAGSNERRNVFGIFTRSSGLVDLESRETNPHRRSYVLDRTICHGRSSHTRCADFYDDGSQHHQQHSCGTRNGR